MTNIGDGFFQLRTVLYVLKVVQYLSLYLVNADDEWCSILGLGNAADAIEILSIGYILAVYEDKEGVVLTRTQQSKTRKGV